MTAFRAATEKELEPNRDLRLYSCIPGLCGAQAWTHFLLLRRPAIGRVSMRPLGISAPLPPRDLARTHRTAVGGHPHEVHPAGLFCGLPVDLVPSSIVAPAGQRRDQSPGHIIHIQRNSRRLVELKGECGLIGEWIWPVGRQRERLFPGPLKEALLRA